MVFNKKNQKALQILRSKISQLDFDEHQKWMKFLEDVDDFWSSTNVREVNVQYLDINMNLKEEDLKLRWEKKEQERKKKMEEEDKAAQAHLVVAALITTVTFAAGITMPGGFIGGDGYPHPGSAVLRNSASFKAFIITNALSLMLSSSAVFIHLFIPIMPSKYFFKERTSFLQMAFRFLLFSMGPMVLAFVTGTYAVLAHSDIAIPTCIICLSFFPILVYIFRKLIS